MNKLLDNKWFKFGLVGGIYLLWVVWLNNYWWLIGLVVIYDIYVTEKVHWSFWKKKNPVDGKQTKVVEWVDAIIFAVIAATFIRLFFIEAYTIPTSSMEKSMMVGDYLFVSKTAYGPKMPNTPVAFPFVHHTMPFTASTRSFSEIIHNGYKRLGGFGRVKNDDVVVFNFPEGDTVATNMQERSYYEMVRSYGRERVNTDKRSFGDIIYRPVDKRENYIKRCIAIPGDSLKLVNGQVYVNGKAQKEISGMQYKYLVTIQGNSLNSNAMEKLDITPEDIEGSGSRMVISLTADQYRKLDGMKFITSKERVTWPKE